MKIKKLTPEQAQALANLQQNTDFKIYMEYVGNYGEDVIMALVKNPTLENPEYHRGTAGGITEVIGSIEQASIVLEQYNNQDK